MAWKTKPPYNIPVNPAHPLANGLQGCWLFNEGEGLVANDISGNSNTGTLTGAPAWTTGNGGGNALEFGDTKYVSPASTIAALSKTGTFSIAGILKTGADVTTTQTVMQQINASDNLAVTSIASGVFAGGCWTGAVYQGKKSGVVAANTWYSFVYTYDGTNGALYINGTAQTGTANPNSNTTPNGIRIGLRTTNANPFLGIISHIAVWSRILTAAEALALHNNPYDMFLDPQVNFLRGTATVTQGNTTAVVTHGLGFVPSLVWLQPLSDSGKKWFVTNRTATTFQINLPVAQEADVSFNYGVA